MLAPLQSLTAAAGGNRAANARPSGEPNMRAMGPGSVSSLLKSGLDVFWIALIAATAAFTVAAALSPILFRYIPPSSVPRQDGSGALVPVTLLMFTSKLAQFAAYSAVLLFIVRGLRRVFLTLVAGDPFRPDNVNRLRGVGLGLAGLAGLNLIVRVYDAWLFPGVFPTVSGWPDLTAWFSVLVVFVLAEVFREGARLRREAELTI
jgi:Protein of unknown function (DUF2975)